MSRPVLSADDVRAAHRRKESRLPVPAGAIVTPLARDEAERWGIELVEESGAAGGSSRAEDALRSGGPPAATTDARPHAATCDPDDVERIVERVRQRVPGADPAQVREIARRVLERLGP